MRKRKQYRTGPNIAEFELENLMETKSIEFSRRGYPDYTVIKDDKIYGFIEVKPKRTDKLRKGQELFANFCRDNKIPFIMWCPGDEFPDWF